MMAMMCKAHADSSAVHISVTFHVLMRVSYGHIAALEPLATLAAVVVFDVPDKQVHFVRCQLITRETTMW